MADQLDHHLAAFRDGAEPRTNLTGSGAARLTGPATVEGEMKLSGNFQGHAVQMSTRMSGKRLGPCKS